MNEVLQKMRENLDESQHSFFNVFEGNLSRSTTQNTAEYKK